MLVSLNVELESYGSHIYIGCLNSFILSENDKASSSSFQIGCFANNEAHSSTLV
jgi:hypothetical protein